jgi:iron-sulfur cluster assembly accessory protein
MLDKVRITDCAAETIRLLIGTKYGHGLRVKVVEGCSGVEYKMAIDSATAEDRVFGNKGGHVFLDPKSMLHLSGTELDYKDGLMQSEFVFNVPAVRAAAHSVACLSDDC